MSMEKISIIICTYNRVNILKDCLKSVLLATKNNIGVEILVVNNNSTDNTEELVLELLKSHPNLKYFNESNTGLSYARNSGARLASYEWLVYIDDDVLIESNFIATIEKTIKTNNYDAFGGKDAPWYRSGKPNWMQNKYLSNNLAYDQPSTLKDNQFMIGCIMILKKELVLNLGGFNTKLGMSGEQVAYGEETDLQIKAKAAGYKIGYNPSIEVKHLVAPYKMKLSWLFISHFNLGRDMLTINDIDINSNIQFFFILITGLIQGCLYVVINIFKYIFIKDYYLENIIIDSFKKPAKRAGMLYHILLLRASNPK